MSEMRLLVAQALAAYEYRGYGKFDWNECTTRDQKSHYMCLALVAIEAMHNPTQEMIAAGVEAMPAAEGFDLPNDCPNVWRAMIDAT